MSDDIKYLTEVEGSINVETSYEIEKAESKGCPRRKFFKVDSEGYLYTVYDRPSEVIEREDYDE